MKARKTKQQVMEELNLDRLPDDEFMELYAFAAAHGEGPVEPGPDAERIAGPQTTPAEIAEAVQTELVARNVGELLSQARRQSGLSQSALAEKAGVGRSWVNQAERKEYLELPSLVRLAGAMGYRVRIELEPKEDGKKSLWVELEGRP